MSHSLRKFELSVNLIPPSRFLLSIPVYMNKTQSYLGSLFTRNNDFERISLVIDTKDTRYDYELHNLIREVNPIYPY